MIDVSEKVAEKFVQHSPNFNGTMARNPEMLNENTIKRIYAENTIKGLAATQNKDLNRLVTGILTSYPDQLSAYIIAHGETPIQYDPVKLALQAVILRAKDVAKNAVMIDESDEDALQDIEQTEMGAQDINSPDNFSSLTTDAQAAIKIAMDHMKDLHEANGGDGSLNSVVNDMNNYAVQKGNAVTSDNGPYASYFDLPGLATIPVDQGNINPLTGMPTITAGPAPTSNTSGIVNSGSGSGILDTITSILNGIGSVAGSVTNAANSVGQAGNAVHNAVSNRGSSSIETYFRNNSTTILIAILGIAILLFVVIYAARKS